MLYNTNWNVPTNSVRETLLRAANLLEERGHVKYTLKDPNGSMCALGAILEAEGYKWNHDWEAEDSLTRPAATAICKALGLESKGRWGPQSVVAEWNNDPAISPSDVMKGMRQAADYVLTKEKVDVV